MPQCRGMPGQGSGVVEHPPRSRVRGDRIGGFQKGKLERFWLVDIVVLPMRLQSPSASSFLSLTSPLGTLCSVQWLAESICLCICQALSEPLRRQPHQAPVSKHFLASTIVSGFGVYMWDGYQSGAVSGWPFLQALIFTLSPYSLL